MVWADSESVRGGVGLVWMWKRTWMWMIFGSCAGNRVCVYVCL